MALAANKVSPTLSVVVVILLLVFAAPLSVHARAAPFSVHARSRSYGGKQIRSTSGDDDARQMEVFFARFLRKRAPPGVKYEAYQVMLRARPNGGGEANGDDKAARRRWYESFLPSALTDSGEPRLLDCYSFRVNGFLARLTRAEAWALAHDPRVRSMFSDEMFRYSTKSCGFGTAATPPLSSVLARLARLPPVRPRSVSYGKKRSTWDDDRDYEALKGWLDFQRHRDGRKYQTYQVRLRKHPDNGEAAMDMVDKDARRRWYESFLDFLPSTLTDSGEPRLLHCYPPYDFNGFLANLTMDEAWVLANKPGIRRMLPDYGDSYSYSTTSCGFETTANTKRLRRV